MPFQCAGKHGPMCRSRLINALEQAGAEGAAIDNCLVQAQPLERMSIKNTPPLAVAALVELIGMLEMQKRFCFAVTRLLTQIGARRLPAMVPDEGAGRERDPVARLLQSPADIDVIARLAKLRIEAIDRLERLP